MVALPSFDRWDYAAGASVLGLLLVAYLVYPHPLVQYGVWLTIFTIWMAWFVSFGVRWVYANDDGEPGADGAGSRTELEGARPGSEASR
jgi:hypothetical protein